MKLGVAGKQVALGGYVLAGAWLSVVFGMTMLPGCRGCGTDPRPPAARDDDPTFVMTEAEQRQACEKAAANLTRLSCRESRPDFADFCVNAVEGKIPIRPLCLASMSDCSEIDGRCRTGVNGGP